MLYNLRNAVYNQGDDHAALSLYAQSVEMKRNLRDKDGIH